MRPLLFSLLLSSLFYSACLRKEKPSPEDKKEESSAPSASSAERSATPTESASPSAEPAPSPDAAQAPPGETGFREVSGEELLGHIRTSQARATIVNAWASWCGPCRQEFPMLVELRRKLESQGVQILFVSVDAQETLPAALQFAQTYGEPTPLWIARPPLSDFKPALNPRWPGMLPATFLYDADGKLRYFWGGPVFENEVLPIIEGFLRGEDIDGEARFGLSPGMDFRNE